MKVECSRNTFDASLPPPSLSHAHNLDLACNHLHTPVTEEQAQTFADDEWFHQINSNAQRPTLALSQRVDQLKKLSRKIPAASLPGRSALHFCANSSLAAVTKWYQDVPSGRNPFLLFIKISLVYRGWNQKDVPGRKFTWGVAGDSSSLVGCGASQTCFFVPCSYWPSKKYSY